MIAIIFTMGTKYDCNLDHENDHLWLQSWSRKWPNMIAMIMTKWTQYEYNLYKTGTMYDCNVGIRPEVTWLWFLDESHENKFSIIAIIFGPFWKILQSYMVRYGVEIAFILGPHYRHHRNYTWSLLRSRLQSYLVPILKIIAIISG